MPSFRQVLEGVAEAWRTRRDEIRESAPRTVEGLSAASRVRAPEGELSPEILDEAERNLAAQFDPNFGGFGGAPKFPPASALEFLMARVADPAREEPQSAKATEIVTTTLERMAKGGIYDQVGGGFARYSVDAHWLVPHFEKMLYDNALLAAGVPACVAADRPASSSAGSARRRSTGRCGRCAGPEGGFYSALDADSEGEEGKFYVWTEAELRELLGDDAAPLLAVLGRRPRAELRRPQHPARRGGRGRTRHSRASAADPLRRAREARLAGPRRQAACGVERA